MRARHEASGTASLATAGDSCVATANYCRWRSWRMAPRVLYRVQASERAMRSLFLPMGSRSGTADLHLRVLSELPPTPRVRGMNSPASAFQRCRTAGDMSSIRAQLEQTVCARTDGPWAPPRAPSTLPQHKSVLSRACPRVHRELVAWASEGGNSRRVETCMQKS